MTWNGRANCETIFRAAGFGILPNRVEIATNTFYKVTTLLNKVLPIYPRDFHTSIKTLCSRPYSRFVPNYRSSVFPITHYTSYVPNIYRISYALAFRY